MSQLHGHDVANCKEYEFDLEDLETMSYPLGCISSVQMHRSRLGMFGNAEATTNKQSGGVHANVNIWRDQSCLHCDGIANQIGRIIR